VDVERSAVALGHRSALDKSQANSQAESSAESVSLETIKGFAALNLPAPRVLAVDGSHRIPNVNSSGEDIDLCEAPLDDSLEPRFPVIGRCRRSES
jgi:hypothetical protein